MAPYNFDDRTIKWNTLTLPTVGELKHLHFTMLSVDEEGDFHFKKAAVT